MNQLQVIHLNNYKFRAIQGGPQGLLLFCIFSDFLFFILYFQDSLFFNLVFFDAFLIQYFQEILLISLYFQVFLIHYSAFLYSTYSVF